MKVRGSIIIAVPPEKVWPFLVEPEKILKWCITFKTFEYTGEKHSGSGTTAYVEEQAGGLLMKLNFEVTEWVENRRLAFSMTSGTWVRSYLQKWTVSPFALKDGSQFIFMEEVVLPFGIIGKLIGIFAQRSSEARVEEMLIKLKRLAEA